MERNRTSLFFEQRLMKKFIFVNEENFSEKKKRGWLEMKID